MAHASASDLAKLTQLANLQYSSGRYREALAVCEKVYSLDAARPDNLLLLGALHFQLRNFSEAIFYSQQAVRVDPTFAEAYSNLGNALKVVISRRHYIRTICTCGLPPLYSTRLPSSLLFHINERARGLFLIWLTFFFSFAWRWAARTLVPGGFGGRGCGTSRAGVCTLYWVCTRAITGAGRLGGRDAVLPESDQAQTALHGRLQQPRPLLRPGENNKPPTTTLPESLVYVEKEVRS
jgi:hypothetical protein